MDMRGKLSSKWNEAVASLLLDRVRERKGKPAWDALPERSDTYILELITAQMEHARSAWRDAQPKTKEDGNIEGLDEVEQRMNKKKEENGKMGCTSMRHRAVSPVIQVFWQ